MASPSSTQLLSLPSSSSSSSNKQWTYDVFLSFRGKDTRKSFTDHLYAALTREGIFTFRDDEQLERGKPISSKLLQAIEESRIALVVFSKNYASSTWCLDEIAKIVKCMKEMGQIVVPIFYDVDPSEVRTQTGSFAEAFDAHEERFKNTLDKVQRWRTSLTQVANLSGFHLQDRYESDFIQEIIERILSNWIRTLPTVSKDLVGISSRVKKMMKICLRIENENNVEFIGIWGMSGIGKTTLARALYDKISTRFQARSFLENVGEVSKRGGIVAVQENLLFDLQMKSETKKRDVHRGISEICHRLRHKKVLIVIDDVDSIEQLEALAGSSKWFGQGSRIIITTRDEQLLIASGVGKIFKVMELKYAEAFKLFSWKVFKNDHPPKDYMELSHDFVNYVKGHPLTINILASRLCGKSIIEWEYIFTSLKTNLRGDTLSELLELLPLRFYEGRGCSGVKYYNIEGKFTDPQTALALQEIIQEYSGQHDLRYSEHFLQSEFPESFCCVKGSSATFTLSSSLDSIIRWKGIALCVSVAVHRDPSLILDDLYSENPYIINCRLVSMNRWSINMNYKITKSEPFGLKRVGLILIYYRSRGSFPDKMVNGCSSMYVRFHANSKDVTILSCGYQVVFHQNVDELVETIMLCSRKLHSDDEEGDSDDDDDDDDDEGDSCDGLVKS